MDISYVLFGVFFSRFFNIAAALPSKSMPRIEIVLANRQKEEVMGNFTDPFAAVASYLYQNSLLVSTVTEFTVIANQVGCTYKMDSNDYSERLKNEFESIRRNEYMIPFFIFCCFFTALGMIVVRDVCVRRGRSSL